jgi:tripartite-type tricarboxylate transporter receptor subunit TctC
MRRNTTSAITLLVLLLAASAATRAGASYENKTVDLVIGYAAGGGYDA